MYMTLRAGDLYSFFDWLVRQTRGKGGRRRGTKHKSSLGIYWKLYCLVYERATGEKINGQINRVMHGYSASMVSDKQIVANITC